MPTLGTVLANMPGMRAYVSRIFGAETESGRWTRAAAVLIGSVAIVVVAACGEAEPEATPTPVATPQPLVTAPAMSPSPAPIPTATAEPTPTATPQPTPTAQPVPRPVTPSEAPAAPPPTPVPTEAPEATPEAPVVTLVGVVLPEVGLNVRDTPSVDEGAVQYVALRDEELELTGETTEIDGIVWYQLADGHWVQGQYLEISERAPAAMPEATPEATPEGTAPTIGVVLPEIGLNVRDAPSVADGAVQYVALQGEELVLTGQTVEAEDALWYELEDGNWVQGQYLEFNP